MRVKVSYDAAFRFKRANDLRKARGLIRGVTHDTYGPAKWCAIDDDERDLAESATAFLNALIARLEGRCPPCS